MAGRLRFCLFCASPNCLYIYIYLLLGGCFSKLESAQVLKRRGGFLSGFPSATKRDQFREHPPPSQKGDREAIELLKKTQLGPTSPSTFDIPRGLAELREALSSIPQFVVWVGGLRHGVNPLVLVEGQLENMLSHQTTSPKQSIVPAAANHRPPISLSTALTLTCCV